MNIKFAEFGKFEKFAEFAEFEKFAEFGKFLILRNDLLRCREGLRKNKRK